MTARGQALVIQITAIHTLYWDEDGVSAIDLVLGTIVTSTNFYTLSLTASGANKITLPAATKSAIANYSTFGPSDVIELLSLIGSIGKRKTAPTLHKYKGRGLSGFLIEYTTGQRQSL
ncbi:hypothetical protein EHS13_25220 [Paenibacillus psychroresistens]|uniref:Uncharacterized protein n=1 Tax=Paenibacillus psychroresistens TaxID=1778678 RepID=A0A6B8RQZ0_9BACL|nr:hypothetical protein [Paenibacillus psychroresistens]QGQ97955.1 hypothetical protein EHS13_25220 [Paenibacillus psychroresistens]